MEVSGLGRLYYNNFSGNCQPRAPPASGPRGGAESESRLCAADSGFKKKDGLQNKSSLFLTGVYKKAQTIRCPPSGGANRQKRLLRESAARQNECAADFYKKFAANDGRLRRIGAGNGARTRYLHLGKVALYQMSYGRILETLLGFLDWCLRSESNQ